MESRLAHPGDGEHNSEHNSAPMVLGTSKPTLCLQAPKLMEENTHSRPHFPSCAPQALRELSSGTEEGCFPWGSSPDPSLSPGSLPPEADKCSLYCLATGLGLSLLKYECFLAGVPEGCSPTERKKLSTPCHGSRKGEN